MGINYFSKIVSIFFFCLLVTTLQAKDIYLSATGNDGNDGLTEATAVATVTKAFSLFEDNDVIRVSGIVDITQDPNWLSNTGLTNDALGNRGWNVSIVGTDKATSGFTSDNKSRFSNEIAGYGDVDKTYIIKDLTFKNLGVDNLGGGSVFALVNNARHMVFENCDFTGIKGNQGCFRIYNSWVTIKDCHFYDNTVKDGGAVLCNGNGNDRPIVIENCIMETNVDPTVTEGRGGAIFLESAGDLTLRNSIIRNNTSGQFGGAIAMIANNSVQGATENKLVVENCLITENHVNHGGILWLQNNGSAVPAKISIINSTLYKNTQNETGGIYISSAVDGSELNIINTTITDNASIGSGANAGHGPGIRFLNGSLLMKKNIFNSIIENNTATTTTNNTGDISTQSADPENLYLLNIRNSYIGYIISDSYTREVDLPEYNNSIWYSFSSSDKAAGLAWPKQDYIEERGCIPLDFESEGLTRGLASYLEPYSSTDQEGNLRSFADGVCAVGAVEPSVIAGVIDEPNDYKHYIIYGQSLSTGHDSDPLSTDNIAGNYMFGNQIWSNYGNTGLNDINPLIASAVSDYLGENPLIGAVNHLRKLIPLTTDAGGKENRFLATSAGTSGKPIEELSKEFEGSNYLYSDYLTALKKGKSAALRRNSTISSPGIVFMQGEWNYQGYGTDLTGIEGTKPTANKEAYKDLFITLKNNMQKDAMDTYEQEKAPVFYTYQTGAQYTLGRTLEIGMAQLEAANERTDIVMVGPVYQMTDVGGHLDANGYRWYGEMIGKVIYKTEILGETFIPLQPTKIERVEDNPKQIRIQFIAPQLPLVLDTETLLEMPNYGFNVYMGGSSQAIADVSIDGINGEYVVITCQNDLTGDIEITYAGVDATRPERNVRGHGNLRDSDDTEGFFDYVERTWNKPTTSGEPMDSDGNIIYNKPYPLYNFSVAFYYQLGAGEESVIVFDPNIEPELPFELNIETASLIVGESIQLNITETTFDDIMWESENPEIATVSDAGLVEALSPGITKITAKDNISGKSAVCEITVEPPFKLNIETATLIIGETVQLSITEDVYDNVSWESENPEIATVSETGLVTAVSAGTTKITVKDNNSDKTAVCQLTVTEPAPEPPFELNIETATLIIGETVQLSITEDAYDNVSWESENPEIATVSETGLVTAVSAGTTKITAKDNISGKTAVCQITVDIKEGINNNGADNTTVYYYKGSLRFVNAEGYQCSIVSVNGQILKTFAIDSPEANYTVNLPAGVYFLKTTGDDKNFVSKFIVD